MALLPPAGRIPSSPSRIGARHIFAALALAAVLAVPASLAAKPDFKPIEPQAIAVDARPVSFDREHPEQRRFGALTWLGGVQLMSTSRRFGGWSGLALDADGKRLIAVSDAGLWLTGAFDYNGSRIAGLRNARIGSLIGPDGKALAGIKETDAEAVTPAALGPLGASAYVAFERHHRVGLFPVAADGLGRAKKYIALPKGVLAAKSNSGLEGLAVIQAGPLKGTLVAFTESLTGRDGNHRGWLIGGRSPGAIALKRLDGYSITDLAGLPDGGLLVLERYFTWTTGVRMRIRRIAARDIRPGALLEGEVLIEAGPALTIDNMEAIATHRGPRGETVITLLSDDNYSPLQRTLLLQFRLDDAAEQ